MAKTYYSTLQVTPHANAEEILAAYRSLALQYHPKKNLTDPVTATHKFHSIAEAFDVLGDPTRRSIYNSLGERGLKEGIATCPGFKGGYTYTGDAESIFRGVFGTARPFFSDFNPHTATLKAAAQSSESLEFEEKAAPPDLVVEVSCTLEELYHGCTKQVSFQRRVLSPDTISFAMREEQRELIVRKGLASDNRVVYKNEGHQSVRFEHSDLVLQTVEAPHKSYQRRGDDLLCTVQVTLLDALLGKTVLLVFAS